MYRSCSAKCQTNQYANNLMYQILWLQPCFVKIKTTINLCPSCVGVMYLLHTCQPGWFIKAGHSTILLLELLLAGVAANTCHRINITAI